MSESSSGWVSGFDVYTGSTACADTAYAVTPLARDCKETTRIVVGLLSECNLFEKGHRVYMDSYYSSPELYDELEALGTYACGTVRKNARGYPRGFKGIRITQGQGVFRRREHLMAIE